jgi:hypothetical protein
MTEFKIGDEVAWIVKYIKRDTTHASVNNGVSIQLETSPGNFVLAHNPQLHSASALDVNKELLEAAKSAQEWLISTGADGSPLPTLNAAIAAAEKGA